MINKNKNWFLKGLRDGIPISLGYLAVSFTLGIAAKNAGFTAFQAMLTSLTNNASAGQFAGFTLVAAGAGYLELSRCDGAGGKCPVSSDVLRHEPEAAPEYLSFSPAADQL